MATILLVIIYLTYIGLGIPDSLLGASWPAIYQDLDLPMSYANYVSLFISSGTIIASFMSARLIKKFGTSTVTAVSTFLTAVCLLGYSFSDGMLWFCLLGIPLGLGGGAIDTALNNYVALHYNAMQMSFLHCFYGVGVSLSPYLMSLALSDNNDWRGGYRTMFIIQIILTAIVVFTLPLWKKVNLSSVEEEKDFRILKTSEILRKPLAKSTILIFMGSCAIESICLVWGGTFLFDSKGVTTDRAAEIITFYFIGLALGRLVSGFLAKKLSSMKIILLGQSVLLLAIIILLLPLNLFWAGLGLFLVGFGNGPLFPNMTHLTPQFFGKEDSRSILGFEMAMAYVSILLAPIIFGFLAEALTTSIFAIFLLAMFILMFAPTMIVLRYMKRNNKDIL